MSNDLLEWSTPVSILPSSQSYCVMMDNDTFISGQWTGTNGTFTFSVINRTDKGSFSLAQQNSFTLQGRPQAMIRLNSTDAVVFHGKFENQMTTPDDRLYCTRVSVDGTVSATHHIFTRSNTGARGVLFGGISTVDDTTMVFWFQYSARGDDEFFSQQLTYNPATDAFTNFTPFEFIQTSNDHTRRGTNRLYLGRSDRVLSSHNTNVNGFHEIGYYLWTPTGSDWDSVDSLSLFGTDTNVTDMHPIGSSWENYIGPEVSGSQKFFASHVNEYRGGTVRHEFYVGTATINKDTPSFGAYRRNRYINRVHTDSPPGNAHIARAWYPEFGSEEPTGVAVSMYEDFDPSDGTSVRCAARVWNDNDGASAPSAADGGVPHIITPLNGGILSSVKLFEPVDSSRAIVGFNSGGEFKVMDLIYIPNDRNYVFVDGGASLNKVNPWEEFDFLP